MHKLEITGATPEELYFNSVKMLSVLLKGAATTAPAEPAQTAPAESGRTALVPPADPGAATKKRRGSKNADPGILNDEIPDLGAKTLTLDGDIRPRLREIQKAHTGRGNDMPTCVSYIQKLYGPFGITKADELKPEQFVEFMEASEAFVSGEA